MTKMLTFLGLAGIVTAVSFMTVVQFAESLPLPV